MRLAFGLGRTFLLAGVLLCCARTSLAQTETTPNSSTPGQAIPGTGGVSPFAGSVPAKLVPGVMQLSLQDAIDRGLKQNLGLLLSNADIRSARGQRWEQLSALLPHVTAAPYVDGFEDQSRRARFYKYWRSPISLHPLALFLILMRA